jgi:hypothetical protein
MMAESVFKHFKLLKEKHFPYFATFPKITLRLRIFLRLRFFAQKALSFEFPIEMEMFFCSNKFRTIILMALAIVN